MMQSICVCSSEAKHASKQRQRHTHPQRERAQSQSPSPSPRRPPRFNSDIYYPEILHHNMAALYEKKKKKKSDGAHVWFNADKFIQISVHACMLCLLVCCYFNLFIL